MPALCPMTRGSNRSLAQRLLPSMMIATCSGGGNWLTEGSLALDLHDLRFLAGCHLVDEADEPVGHLLQLLAAAAGFIGRNLLLFLQRLDPVDLFPADVPDGDVGVLGIALHQPRILATALLIQGRNRHPDHLPIVAR